MCASTLKPEEFIADSGASMHMISKKDQSKAEMDTLTKSCSRTIVITANGEVQTHEEVIVYVKELDMFLTMKVLENTPAVLSFGTFCDENGCDDSEIREWLQESRGKVVDDEIQLQGVFHASSSHEASLEPTSKRRQDWGKHNVHDHFPKDRNCEICKRTKITRAP